MNIRLNPHSEQLVSVERGEEVAVPGAPAALPA
jgi:hypothetical protein